MSAGGPPGLLQLYLGGGKTSPDTTAEQDVCGRLPLACCSLSSDFIFLFAAIILDAELAFLLYGGSAPFIAPATYKSEAIV